MLGGQLLVPVFTGGRLSVSVGDRSVGGGGSRQRRVGEGHLCVVPDSVNGFLQFYFTDP